MTAAGGQRHARVQVGPVSAELRGDPRLVRALAAELGTAPGERPAPGADVRLLVTALRAGAPGPPPAGAARRSRFPYTHLAWSGGGLATFELRAKAGPALYRVTLPLPLPGDGSWDVTAAVPSPNPVAHALLDIAARAATRDGSDLAGATAKNLLDEVLDPLLWLRLLGRGGALLHASAAVAPGERGVLLLGAGGSGKTGTLLELVGGSGWRYLAEDRAVLEGGRVHRHPRRARLLGHHAAALGERGLPPRGRRLDRLARTARTAVLGGGGVGRRVRPEDALGPALVADRAALSCVFALRPAGAGAALRLAPLPGDHLARWAASAACNQSWDFLRHLGLLAGAGEDRVPTPDELFARTRDAVAAQTAGLPAHVVEVPPHASWRQVAAVVADAVA